MTHPHHHAPPPSIRPATLAWLWGGGAILVSGLMRVLQALPITAVIGSGPVTLLAAGAFALEALFTLLNFAGVPSTYRDAVQGAIIILAVAYAAISFGGRRRARPAKASPDSGPPVSGKEPSVDPAPVDPAPTRSPAGL